MAYRFSVIENIDKCREVWNSLASERYFTDIWEFRSAFHLASRNKPYFLLASISGKPAGLIPLEKTPQGHHYFFGEGGWNEKLRLFMDPEHEDAAPFLITKLPRNTYLRFLHQDEQKWSTAIVPFEKTYYLSCNEIKNDFDIFLSRIKKKSRHNLRNELKRIQSSGISITYDNFSDIDHLISLNKKRFAEESSFVDPEFEGAIRSIILDPRLKKYLRFISINSGEKVVACSLGIMHKKIFTYFIGGSDPEINNISKYLVFQNFQEGFRNDAERIDFLADDCGWKEHWKLDSEMLYKLEKN